MKYQNYKKSVLVLGVLLIAVFAGTSESQARERDHHRYYNKSRDSYSYRHQHYHSRGAYYRYYAPRDYVYYRNHRGYWEDRSGIRFFIRID